jgi:hypothetical protein
MLSNVQLNLYFIFISATMLGSHRNIVPSGVTVSFLLFVQCKLIFQDCQDLLCTFTDTDLTEDFLVTMELHQMILHGLDCGLSMLPVL